MIYKNIGFQLLPYGASIKLTCTKSSKKGELIENYIDSTNYTTSIQEIGTDGSYFLLSEKEPVEMSYSYTKNNGILVEIITNLQVIADPKDIKNDGNGHYSIINETWLATGYGRFSISNQNWFEGNKLEEPYIKLCFNEVKAECCFTNPWNGQGGNYCDNGWSGFYFDSLLLTPGSQEVQNECSLYRYFKISWNKKESNQLLYDIYRNDGHWFQAWFSTEDENGNIINFNNGLPSNPKMRIWSVTDALTQAEQKKRSIIEIPPLNGTGILNNITLHNYFKIGYTINFYGDSGYQSSSILKINENNYNYNSNGFIYKTNLKDTIESVNSNPVLYSHPSNENWSTNSKFYKTKTGHYISPSDGLQISSEWREDEYCVPYSCNCDYYCSCDNDYCSNDYCRSDCDDDWCDSDWCDDDECSSDGGGSKPWETEKEYVGGSGYSWSAVKEYNYPNGSHVASIPAGKRFSVYYYWNGWYQVAGNNWIRADADWDYS